MMKKMSERSVTVSSLTSQNNCSCVQLSKIQTMENIVYRTVL